MQIIDLFSGIGGFSLAGHWVGWQTVQFCEIDAFCGKVLSKNFPGVPIHQDIKTLTRDNILENGIWKPNEPTIAVGGFPCQPYSHAGKRKGNDDDRALWPEMLRVIREVEPMWVVGENVAGLISMDGGRVFAGIVTDLENAGYTVEAFVVPACAVGAPHRRDRLWIVAHREGNGTPKLNSSAKARQQIPATPDTYGRSFATADAERIGWDGRSPTEAGNVHRDGTNRQWQSAGEFGDAAFVASDSAGRGLRRRTASGKPGQHTRSSETASDAHGIRLQERNTSALAGDQRFGSRGIDPAWDEHWLPVAARLCRMDDGISPGLDGTAGVPANAAPKNKTSAGRAHRLKALGNAIVPQVAYEIFKAIKQQI